MSKFRNTSYEFCSPAGFLMKGSQAKRLVSSAEHTRRSPTAPFNQYVSGILREKSEEKIKLLPKSTEMLKNW